MTTYRDKNPNFVLFDCSGKQRTKKEASMNTNKHNPGGHERKIVTKLMNAEKNNLNRVVPPVGGGSSKN